MQKYKTTNRTDWLANQKISKKLHDFSDEEGIEVSIMVQDINEMDEAEFQEFKELLEMD